MEFFTVFNFSPFKEGLYNPWEVALTVFDHLVSNELGAVNPKGARLAVVVVMLLAVIETTIVTLTFFASRSVFGYTFSNEKEFVDYVTDMAPLVCLSVIMDSIQDVLSGVARGCGWQLIGAYVNLAAYYLFGIPIAAALAFLKAFEFCSHKPN